MPIKNDNICEVPIANDNGDENINDISNDNECVEKTNLSCHLPDICDPRTWDVLDSRMNDRAVSAKRS